MAEVFEATPDEQYLRDACRDGMAIRRHVLMSSLKNPDIKLQARVQHLNPAHVERLRESLREAGTLRPIVTFREPSGSNLWLADGFHRHEAYRLEGHDSIPCYVVEGGYREALKFATMCNRENCLGRTTEDKQKAACMLFADEEWGRKMNAEIAEHIGVAKYTIAKWRAIYAVENNVSLPEEVIDRAGRKRPTRLSGNSRAALGRPDNLGRYVKVINGKRHRLGRDPEKAKVALAALVGDPDESGGRFCHDNITFALTSRGIHCVGAPNYGASRMGQCSLVAGAVLVSGDVGESGAIPTLVGRALLNREKHRPGGRAVVVCHNPPHCEALEVAGRLGVEFLTLEKLIESIR